MKLDEANHHLSQKVIDKNRKCNSWKLSITGWPPRLFPRDFTSMRSYLDLGKVCAWWVPRELTLEKKAQCVTASQEHLECYRVEGMISWSPLSLGMNPRYPITIQKTERVNVMEAYQFPKCQKVQRCEVHQENHGLYFFRSKRNITDRFFARRRNNEPRLLL